MAGRHFLQIPGPTNVPERILRAMDRAVIDHRGPDLPAVVNEAVAGLKQVFGTTRGEIVLYPASGTGAWEASLVNTLNAGDHVLAFVNGHFSQLYAECARRLGAVVETVEVPWGEGVPPEVVHTRLSGDTARRYRALLVVHNETSTGAASDLAAIRAAIDAAGHPALFFVDVVSALGGIELQFDAWKVDVALTGSQKGLMLPPGMAVLCAGPRALEAGESATLPRYFFDWRPVIREMQRGYFPYTPATLTLYGMREAVRMLLEEGLPNVMDRHRRLAEGVRRAVAAWGLENLCPRREWYSNSLTAVVVPDGADSDAVVRAAAQRLNLSLGVGLGRVKGKVFRIGHLGALNELEVLATLAGTELACTIAGIPVPLGSGVTACERFFAEQYGAGATAQAGRTIHESRARA